MRFVHRGWIDDKSVFMVNSSAWNNRRIKSWNIIDRNACRHMALTHWGRDTIAAISQTTFSNAFSWMEMYEFRLKFHSSLFLRLDWSAPSHYLDQWWLVYWHKYAPLGLDGLLIDHDEYWRTERMALRRTERNDHLLTPLTSWWGIFNIYNLKYAMYIQREMTQYKKKIITFKKQMNIWSTVMCK